jgi:hypothetical protein
MSDTFEPRPFSSRTISGMKADQRMETRCSTFRITLSRRSWRVILNGVETQATSHKCKCLEFNPRFAESRLIKLRKLTLRHLASASATNCHPLAGQDDNIAKRQVD